MSHKYFKKPCTRCDELFTPTGKYQKLCNKCRDIRHASKETLKKKYYETKKKIETINHNATLAKWKALSHGYSLGKRIWGSRFTRQRLSEDMDIPMTTVLRCLSLDRANKKSIKLMEEGKISASKLAMICCSKSVTYQDEIVKMVIDGELTTYQIKSIKINNIKDVGLENLRLAVEKGFSRDSSALKSFDNWIERGNIILLLKKSILNDKKNSHIKEKLMLLNKKIERYIDD